ncbi:ABC transporter ATP-binding protein [Paeniglutamicibacter psychrophenolicus]|uniref:ABC transporter ATP-binding protein n=1 Tax=Paeniglutamicibacter psychrophenolicus TaxID=257454 RepID=UPI002789ADF6|nr:ABC transporter ATP-binding protein [Paeniglutamicibacter psychrophenolicus]MDQ0093834.1 putative ABC transport system ATP-binding protein [Paeniglutamicibacter psychrophenolicus]
MTTPEPTQPAATTNMPLQLIDLTLEYPDGQGTIKALDSVNLGVGAGQMLSLIGPSGSGKSSLLAVAATLIRPTSGLVIIDGTTASDLNDKEMTTLRREKVGIIFQQPNLLASMTALEQLMISDHLRGKPLKPAKARALELLQVVGLEDSATKRPHQLSGGQRQRVNIARALMGSPKVLLVDEPTAALDHARSESIVRLLAEVTREFSVATVMVTHDTEFISLTDSVATMRDGVLGASELVPA